MWLIRPAVGRPRHSHQDVDLLLCFCLTLTQCVTPTQQLWSILRVHCIFVVIAIIPKSITYSAHRVQVVDNLASELSIGNGSVCEPEDLGVHIDTLNFLSGQQLLRVDRFLVNWRHAFSTNNLYIGKKDLVKHNIDLADDIPFSSYITRYVWSDQSTYQDAAVIRESKSRFEHPFNT